MKFIKALILSLGDSGKPVVTRYQLGLIMHRLYRKKEYKSEEIFLQKDSVESREFHKYLNQLIENGILDPYRGLPVYSLLGSVRESADILACSIDPFCYLSHLSAMSYHGLTDRIPSKLFISSPGGNDWKMFADERMVKDLGEDYSLYCQSGMPLLARIKMERLGKTEVRILNSKHLGAYKNIRDSNVRVSTIGRTFLDSIVNPELCGGINHVLNVYDENAERYLRLITDEIEKNGRPIDKVRAGYILDERLGLKSDVVEGWVKFVQRGGSRKLDSSYEYIPQWSDKWCLSLNVFEAK